MRSDQIRPDFLFITSITYALDIYPIQREYTHNINHWGGYLIKTNSSFIKLVSENSEVAFLLFTVLLSWLGMKTVAGYSWIIFIFVATSHMIKVYNSMGMLGAIYIISIAISLFLQISNYSDIKGFFNDFRGKS